jgi:uncharacterized protein
MTQKRPPEYTDIPEVFRRAMEDEGWRESRQDPPEPPPPPTRPPLPEKPWWADRRAWLLGLLFLFIFSLDWLIAQYIDWLWFSARHYDAVWLTQLLVQIALLGGSFLVAFVILWWPWRRAYHTAVDITIPQTSLSPLQAIPAFPTLLVGIALFLAFSFASTAASQWDTLLLYFNRVHYGMADPIFGQDVSFYLFNLPLYNFIQGWFAPLILFALLGVVAIYTLALLPRFQMGQLRPQDIPQGLRQSVASLSGLFFLLWGIGYWLETYGLLFSPLGIVYGAGYADVNASLWALYVQMGVVFLLALTLFYNVYRFDWRPVVAMGIIWLAAGILLGGLYPAVLQRFVVEPTELTRETPYIRSNIEFTRAAFGIDNVDVRPFGTVGELTEQHILDNEVALRNVRLWDYRPLLQTYRQLQELRPYYEFNDVDVDRYTINGEIRQVMLSGRELEKSLLPNVTWVNQKLEFTHGYGVVMNPVDRYNPQGRPEFFISDLPARSNIDIEVTRPEIYYGERTNDVVFAGSGLREFSYPDDNDNFYTSYVGTGGVPIGNSVQQLLFALHLGDLNLLFSEYITPQTKVLLYRNIQERISKITPFLLLDRDPYLVIENGRLIWIQDAYTVSNYFPYSQPLQLPQGQSINYIRNSVKVTVDAYNGEVTYYLFDEQDPIIQAYAQIFPNLFQPKSAFPETLWPHIRYPADLFSVQTRQYLTYHMTDVQVFYNKEDLRAIPDEIFDGKMQKMEPYYVLFRLPGEVDTEYLLIQPYTPSGKRNMIAWIAARNDPAHYGELVAYELPKQELVVGPIQIEGFIDQEPSISAQFSLWNQSGSRVIRGNLIVIPLNDSFLYVEPIYLESSNSSLPELKRVIVASGERIVMLEDLQAALDALVAEDAPAVVVDLEVPEELEGEVVLPEEGESTVIPTPALTLTPLPTLTLPTPMLRLLCNRPTSNLMPPKLPNNKGIGLPMASILPL